MGHDDRIAVFPFFDPDDSRMPAVDPKLPSVGRDLAFKNPRLMFERYWRMAPLPI